MGLRGVLAALCVLLVFAASASALPPNFVGLNFSGDYGHLQNDEDWDAVRRSGAKVLRVNGAWHAVQNAGAAIGADWTHGGAWAQTYDKYFEYAAKNDIAILVDLVGRKVDDGANTTRFYGNWEPGWNEWLQFVWTFVQRYGRGGYFWDAHPNLPYEPVTVWEVWNEPNFPRNNPVITKTQCNQAGNGYSTAAQTCVQPRNYAKFLKATSSTIRAAQDGVRNAGEPNDTVVLHGGLYQYEVGMSVNEFLDKAADVSGFAASFNGLSLHPYSFSGSYSGKLAALQQNLNNARQALDVFVSAAKTIWITELGWPVDGEGKPLVSEGDQASLLNGAFAWLKATYAGYNLQLVTWYAYRDLAFPQWDYHAGLRTVDGRYRPSWWAFRAQTGRPPPPPRSAYELGFVRYNGASGNSEFDAYAGAPNYQGLLSRGPTGHPAISDPANVQALAIDSKGSGIDELGFVRFNAASGRTHLDTYSGAPEYEGSASNCDTAYPSIADPENVDAIAIDATGDGTDELGFVRYSAGGSAAYLDMYSGAGSGCYQTPFSGGVTGYPSIPDPQNIQALAIDVNGDNQDELAFVRLKNNPTGNAWISTYTASSGYRTASATCPTGYPTISDPENVDVMAVDTNGDGIDELGFLRYNTATGKAHLDTYNAAPCYGALVSVSDTAHPAVSDPQNGQAVAINTTNDSAPGTWRTDNLGGDITSAPDIASMQPNHLHMFAKGATNTLVNKFWTGTAWGNWGGMGGSLTSGPGAVSWASDRLDVVARTTDDSIQHWYYFSGGGWFSDNLGGAFASDPDISSWGPSRLDVFVKGTDNALWHKYWQGAWSGWGKIGGSMASGPGAVSWAPGRIDVVARAPDNTVVHWYWDDSVGGGWRSDNLGGNITSDPDIASMAPYHLHIFAKGANDSLVHKFWNGSTWSAWKDLGGSLTSGPSAVSWDARRLDVVARTTNNTVQHWYYYDPP